MITENHFGINSEKYPLQEKKQDFIHKFKFAKPSNRFIYGKNIYTDFLISEYKINSIIDDTQAGTFHRGIPVISLQMLIDNRHQIGCDSPEALILCTSGGKPLTALSNLENQGLQYMHYFEFRKYFANSFPEIHMNENFAFHFETNYEEFKRISLILTESKSKNIFDTVVRFRYTNNLEELENFRDIQQEQYFEDFINIENSEICFLDVGSFDGQTTIKFIERYPNFHSVYAFEPDHENYKLCCSNLSAVTKGNNVKIFNLGLGAIPGTYEIVGANSTSRIQQQSAKQPLPSKIRIENQAPETQTKVNVVRLDDFIVNFTEEHLTKVNYFYKLDIEGMELDAIKGSETFIRNYSPTIAVCVYHHPNHLWQIPKLILSINPNYRVLVRHYTESIYETVMFFCPIH